MDEPKYTWHAAGVDGHSEKFGSDFLYTSNDAPVEADEYERQRQRALVAEAKLSLVDTFAEWKRNAPKGSLTFEQWLKGRESAGYPLQSRQ